MTSSARGDDEALRAVLEDAAGTAVRRVRRRHDGWWRRPLDDGRTRAGIVQDLIAALVAAEREVGTDPAPPGRDRPPVPPRDDVLVDQFTVVAYDLLRALADPRPDADPIGTTRRAIAHCVLATYDLDPRPVAGAYLDAALAGELGALRERLEALPRLRDA